MCQAYEGERAVVVASESQQIRDRYERHQKGEIKLTDEEIERMAIRLLMLREQ